MPAVRNRTKASGCVRMPHAGMRPHQQRPLAARDLLHVERAVDHEDAHDRGADGDLGRDHQGGRALAAQQRVVVGRGPARHHDAVDAQREHGEDVEDADVERDRLQRDLAAADVQGVAERDRREGGQREEDRHERREPEEQPVGAGRHEVFLGQHLERVGERVEAARTARKPKIEARLAPDAVLHDRRLLALDPGQEPAQVQHEHMTKATARRRRCRGRPATALTACVTRASRRRPSGPARRSIAPPRAAGSPTLGTSARRRPASPPPGRGTSARPDPAASPGRRRARRRPSMSQSGRASPARLHGAVRKRCTRPSKFVKVPSRSTQAALGSTRCARALVALALVPWKTTRLDARERLGHLRRRPARVEQVVVEDPQAAEPARARGRRGCRPSAPRRRSRSARRRGVFGCLVGADQEVVARAPGVARRHAEVHLRGRRACPRQRAAARTGPRWTSGARRGPPISSGRVAAERVRHGGHRLVPAELARGRRPRASSGPLEPGRRVDVAEAVAALVADPPLVDVGVEARLEARHPPALGVVGRAAVDVHLDVAAARAARADRLRACRGTRRAPGSGSRGR